MFDVFSFEKINFALISFSKTVINNKSIENQKCFFIVILQKLNEKYNFRKNRFYKLFFINERRSLIYA